MRSFWLVSKACSLIFSFCLLSGSVLAADIPFSVLGQVGYQVGEFERDIEANGIDLGGFIHLPFVRLAGGPSVFAEGGLKYSLLSGSKDSVDYDWSQLSFSVGGGVQFQAASRFTLQIALDYDFGLSGTMEITAPLIGKKKYDTKDYRRLTNEWRGMFEIYPKTDIGFGIGWYQGQTSWEDFPSSSDDLDMKGFVLRAILDHKF